jgi:16S rRNA (uracil1498-N3)-methyltransferase
MNLFYTPDITADTYTLSEEESKHCVRVLRMQAGDLLHLVDGRGGFYSAEVTDPNPKKCVVTVREKQSGFGKRTHYLHIACAPTKNIERFEWFLEKATEIGIDEITPLLCEHSERDHVKTARLNKVLVSAMKQSVKAYLPRLNEMTKLGAFLDSAAAPQKFIAHCGSGEKKKLKDVLEPGKDCLILIGPEGDFSPAETGLALKKGFAPVSLGASRLRTETAALAAVHTAELLNE